MVESNAKARLSRGGQARQAGPVPTVLIISSHVAASPVGGGAQAAALARMGVETVLIPTVLYGRHPGLGPPGGGPVPQELFEGVIAGVESSGALTGLDAVIAGYFAAPEQVHAATRLIDRARAAAPAVRVVVDPVMGDDERGLYVRDDVAETIARELVPRADLITPNAWELARLSGHAVSDGASTLAAARAISREALVSSVPLGEDIGVLLAASDRAWLASHRCEASAPKGTGDLLTASFVGHLVNGGSRRAALEVSVTEIAAGVAGHAVPIRVEAV
ncbi:MAG: bifunctional hydroxymethylpyrimidine kinase/phosphomethylpyrimidine kinase [Caulobacteraceae bacterium]